tara:strand:+ start:1813 stop:2313 length:501 start_codon:yes stop_codon:yes gene_type:complete
MPKIVKSISLDERTAPIANNKTNFSAWVREKLLEDIEYSIPCSYYPLHHMDGITGKQLFIEIKDENGRVSKKPKITKEICNGVRKPTCSVCYPEGAPDGKDWREYANGRINKTELLARASAKWKWRTDAIKANQLGKESEKSASIPPIVREKKYVRRLLKWIWSYI